MQINRNTHFIFLLSIICFSVLSVKGQDVDGRCSRFSVGIENTRMIYGKYVYRNHYFAKADLSVYSEKLPFQYFRTAVGYENNLKYFSISGSYFFGSAFNGFYYNTGVNLNGNTFISHRLIVDVTLSPWYDSGYGYSTCWQALLGCRLTSHLDLRAGYTTIPEYRMSEKRIIGFFDFHVPYLTVSPYVTIGTKASDGGKNIRMGFKFEYQF